MASISIRQNDAPPSYEESTSVPMPFIPSADIPLNKLSYSK